MKFYFTSLSKNGELDGCLDHHVCTQFERVSPQDAEYVGLVITHTNSYVFDKDQFDLIKNKKVVIFDYVEYGWQITNLNHFYGQNTQKHERLIINKEYLLLDEAIKSLQVVCYFKRELPKDFTSKYNTYPAEYVCIQPIEEPVSFEAFNGRAISIFFNWGLSNPNRLKLHGALYSLSHEYGYSIVSARNHLEGCQKDNPENLLVFSQFAPHYARTSMEEVLHLQRSSKISISLNGCGVKCFRNAESPINSVMAIQQNTLAWTSEWDDTNAIVLPNKKDGMIDEQASITKMLDILKNPENLYARYIKCIENNKIYTQQNYCNELRRRIASH